eukprot:6142303-Prymnesium_polylepis.1
MPPPGGGQRLHFCRGGLAVGVRAPRVKQALASCRSRFQRERLPPISRNVGHGQRLANCSSASSEVTRAAGTWESRGSPK